MASGRLILAVADPVLNSSGEVAAGATLTYYDGGTTDLAAIYADADLSTPIENPQTSNSAGRFYDQTTVIFADDAQAYDALLEIPGGGSLTFENLSVLGEPIDIDGLAPIDSPNFTGVPTAPTPSLNDSSGKIATTAYVQGQAYAPLASPTFTGVPAGPTAAVDTSTTQLATTAFVLNQIAGHVTTTYFQSANIPVSPGSRGTVSHGLGVNPKQVQAVMICTNAINGITVGDEIPVGMNHDTGGDHGPMLRVINDSTTIGYQFPNSTILVLNTSGVSFNATSSNFVMVIRAWTG